MQRLIKNNPSVTFIGVNLILFSLCFFIAGVSAQTTVQEGRDRSLENASVEQDPPASAQPESMPMPFAGNNPINFAGLLVKTIGYFLLIVLLIFLTIYVLKRFVYNRKGFSRQDTAIRVLSSTYVGPKKSLLLVEAAGRVLVISLTDTHMNLITELPKEEYEKYTQREAVEESTSQESVSQFGNTLQRLLKRPK